MQVLTELLIILVAAGAAVSGGLCGAALVRLGHRLGTRRAIPLRGFISGGMFTTFGCMLLLPFEPLHPEVIVWGRVAMFVGAMIGCERVARVKDEFGSPPRWFMALVESSDETQATPDKTA
jgi:hypothetical protein